MTCEAENEAVVEELIKWTCFCGSESTNGATGVALANELVTGAEGMDRGGDACVSDEEDWGPYCRLVGAKDVDIVGKAGTSI